MTEPKKANLSLNGADPLLPFYITGDLWPDGSVDINSEGKDPLSLEAAIDNAMQLVEDHGGTMFVIECRVVRKVTRRKALVKVVKTKSARPARSSAEGRAA